MAFIIFSEGSTPFGYYDTDKISLHHDKTAGWCQRLGYPIVDIELQTQISMLVLKKVTEYS